MSDEVSLTRNINLTLPVHVADWIENNMDFITKQADELLEFVAYQYSDETIELRKARNRTERLLNEMRGER